MRLSAVSITIMVSLRSYIITRAHRTPAPFINKQPRVRYTCAGAAADVSCAPATNNNG